MDPSRNLTLKRAVDHETLSALSKEAGWKIGYATGAKG
jgi:hypothetical protein